MSCRAESSERRASVPKVMLQVSGHADERVGGVHRKTSDCESTRINISQPTESKVEAEGLTLGNIGLPALRLLDRLPQVSVHDATGVVAGCYTEKMISEQLQRLSELEARLTPNLVSLSVEVESVNEAVVKANPVVNVNDLLRIARLEVRLADGAVVGRGKELSEERGQSTAIGRMPGDVQLAGVPCEGR